MTVPTSRTPVPKELAISSPTEPRCILLRHAERPALSPGDPGSDLPLTAAGEAAARTYGRHLAGSISSIRTSPILRCARTAALIRSCAQTKIPIQEDTTLGDPGIYIAYPDLAWENWLKRGQEGVLEHLALGGPPLPGFADPLGSTSQLLVHLLARARAEPGIHVAVTHDAIMIPLLAAVTRRPLPFDARPHFLEVILLGRSKGETFVDYRGDRWSAAHLENKSSEPEKENTSPRRPKPANMAPGSAQPARPSMTTKSTV